MTRKPLGDISAGRLNQAALDRNFADLAPPLDRHRALIEAERCFYCYDAPCIAACPTGIDIPSFIKRISTDNLRGAALDILTANIFGGSCARVCPTEVLCEGDCVRNRGEDKPVEISALQRYATDWVVQDGVRLFQRAAATGQRVAVVGAGPAGLACAHELARHGHQVVVLEQNDRPGGLNEYGIAAYKVMDFVAREIDWLLAIGGIEIRTGVALGRDFSLSDLRAEYAAVFIGIGLTGVNALKLAIEDRSDWVETSQRIEEISGIGAEHVGAALPQDCLPEGVRYAVDFIAELRQTPLAELAVGRRVVVIGGGNTAIDAAVQSKKLGAESVTMVYRRDPQAMSATAAEQAFAQHQGVTIIHRAQPRRWLTDQGVLAAIEFEHSELDGNGNWIGSGDFFRIDADQALLAVGQRLDATPVQGNDGPQLALRDGRIVVDGDYRSTLVGVWAGGDAVGGKLDLTVQSVAAGRDAARSIHAQLSAGASSKQSGVSHG